MSFSDSPWLSAHRRRFSPRIVVLGALAALALAVAANGCAVGAPDAVRQPGGMGGAGGMTMTGGIGGDGGMSSGGMGGAGGMTMTGGIGGAAGMMMTGGTGGAAGMMMTGGTGGGGGMMMTGGTGGGGGMMMTGGTGGGGTCDPATCPAGAEPFPGVPGPPGCCKTDGTCGTMELFGGCA